MSLISSSLLFPQCPTCLVRLILIVFVMGGRWPYSCCFVGCCNINMKSKSFGSLDIKSLFTNLPVDECIKHLIDLLKTNIKLPLPVSKFIKICTLGMSHYYFQPNNTFYKQKFGLPIGSPLSGVLTCIYIELLESGPFNYIILSNSNYSQYIDDILLIYPQKFF